MQIHSSRISGTNGLPEYHFTLFLEDEDIKISGVNDDDLAYIRSKFNRTIRSKYYFNAEVVNNFHFDSRKPVYFFDKNDFKKLVSRCLQAADWINNVPEIINPDFVRFRKFVDQMDSWIAYVQIPLARMINRDFFDRGFHKGAPERDFEIANVDGKRQLVEIGGTGEYQEEVQETVQVAQEQVQNAPQVSMFATMATVPSMPNPTDEVPAPANEETVGESGTVPAPALTTGTEFPLTMAQLGRIIMPYGNYKSKYDFGQFVTNKPSSKPTLERSIREYTRHHVNTICRALILKKYQIVFTREFVLDFAKSTFATYANTKPYRDVMVAHIGDKRADDAAEFIDGLYKRVFDGKVDVKWKKFNDIQGKDWDIGSFLVYVESSLHIPLKRVYKKKKPGKKKGKKPALPELKLPSIV